MAEKVFAELDVDDLYHALEKELGADIATVLRVEHISGEDFLELTEKEVDKMFSKLGQKKKVLRFIKRKHAPTSEVCNYTHLQTPTEKTQRHRNYIATTIHLRIMGLCSY